ncbi:hypothetical protein HG530_001757 [Fusarium avenaceum]|nr:hypothetical protein HG530_001757 [Fusarium avenaceum]
MITNFNSPSIGYYVRENLAIDNTNRKAAACLELIILILAIVLLILNIILQSINKLLNTDLTINLRRMLALPVWWNRNTPGNLDNTILANGILETDRSLSIKDDSSPALESVDINTHTSLKQSRQLEVEVIAVAGELLGHLLVAVVHLIAVERHVGDDLEGVCAGAQTSPGLVGGREDGAADHGDVVNILDEVGLVTDLLADVRRRDENSVDGVDDTVLGFLFMVSFNPISSLKEQTYKVDCDNLAVNINPYSRETNASAKTLGLVAKKRLLQDGRHSMRKEDSRRRILANTEMVVKNILDKLITRLILMMVRDMLKRLISRDEKRVVSIRAVKQLSELLVLLDKLEELLGIVALRDQLIGSMVREVAAGSAKDRRIFITVFVGGGEEGFFVLDLVVDGGCNLGGELVGSLIERLAQTVGDVLEGLFDVVFEVVETIKRLGDDDGRCGRSQCDSQNRPHSESR